MKESKLEIIVISPEDTSPYTPLLVHLVLQITCVYRLSGTTASAACGLSLAEEPVRHKNRTIEFYKACLESIDFQSKICKCRAACRDVRTLDVPSYRLVLAPLIKLRIRFSFGLNHHIDRGAFNSFLSHCIKPL